jgi:hypothetical protein
VSYTALVRLKRQANNMLKFLGVWSEVFLLKYIGIPFHYRKLSNSDWKIVEEHFEK